MSTGLKANSDGSAAIQVGGTDVITLTSGGAATFVTSPTTVQAGTAAAPSITFSGDTNTGIYSPGADTIAFTEGGVESMRIDSAGNMGLAITPSAWGSLYRSLDVLNGGGGFAASSESAIVSANAYQDGSNWKYKITSGGSYGSSFYNQFNGIHALYSAASGTANATITFTEVLSVQRNETLALQGASRSAGTGIAFPATQSASSNANTLDDYEEGSFDPTVTATTPPTGVTYSVRLGRFVKIGKMVQIEITIGLSNKGTGGAGSAFIGNLPFTSATVNGNFPNFGIALDNLTAAVGGQVTGQINSNENQITLVQNTNTTTAVAAMAYSSITNLTQFRASFVYQAAN